MWVKPGWIRVSKIRMMKGLTATKWWVAIELIELLGQINIGQNQVHSIVALSRSQMLTMGLGSRLQTSPKPPWLKRINETTQWNWGQHTLIILSFSLPLEATAAAANWRSQVLFTLGVSILFLSWTLQSQHWLKRNNAGPPYLQGKNPSFLSIFPKTKSFVSDFTDFWWFKPNCSLFAG